VNVYVIYAPKEQRARMSRMHQSAREYDIYRWAGLLLGELSRIPEEAIGTPGASIPMVPRRTGDEDTA
jgi:trehalose-6-phosphate synthase